MTFEKKEEKGGKNLAPGPGVGTDPFTPNRPLGSL